MAAHANHWVLLMDEWLSPHANTQISFGIKAFGLCQSGSMTLQRVGRDMAALLKP